MYTVGVEMSCIAEVAGQREYTGLLVLNLALDELGDSGLSSREPGRRGTGGGRGQIELNSLVGLANGP
jgi:hypothetical protein